MQGPSKKLMLNYTRFFAAVCVYATIRTAISYFHVFQKEGLWYAGLPCLQGQALVVSLGILQRLVVGCDCLCSCMCWADQNNNYCEDSFRLPLGLPVGVVNLPQDHPRLIVSGTLIKKKKKEEHKPLRDLQFARAARCSNLEVFLLRVRQRGRIVGACDSSCRFNNVLKWGCVLPWWRLGSPLLCLPSSRMLLRWMATQRF